MTTYQTKPQTVEAVQWRGDNADELIALCPEGAKFVWLPDRVLVRGSADRFTLLVGWWLIRDVAGDVEAVDDTWFKATYQEKF